METVTIQKSLKLKVCGMKHAHNIEEVMALKPDYLGFIFYPPSKRYIGDVLGAGFVKNLKGVKKVGVFVNAPLADIWHAIEAYGLDMVQLHGQESPGLCRELMDYGVIVIKAFSIGEEDFPFNMLEAYVPFVDYFLFDTKGKLPGGNGVRFNWEALEVYPYETPFFLSGGIKSEHSQQIASLRHLPIHAVDINSGFEIEPGLKDAEQVSRFKNALTKEL